MADPFPDDQASPLQVGANFVGKSTFAEKFIFRMLSKLSRHVSNKKFKTNISKLLGIHVAVWAFVDLDVAGRVGWLHTYSGKNIVENNKN